MREMQFARIEAQESISRMRLVAGALAAQYSFTWMYLITLLASLWAAYDLPAALQRFILLLVGVSLFVLLPLIARLYRLEELPIWVMSFAAWVVALVGTLYIARFIPLPIFGLPIPLRDNQVGGIMAVGLPFALGVLWLSMKARQWFLAGSTGVWLLVGFVAFVLCGSRGGWSGFVAGLVAAIYLLGRSRLAERRRKSVRWLWLADLAVVSVFAIVLLVYVAVLISPALEARLGIGASHESVWSRLALWRDTILLIQDYYFVGSGLASTAMIYSTYSFLLHVPTLHHAHNLYLQIALEQGVPGLLAFLGIIGTSILYAVAAWKQAEWCGRVVLAAAVAAVTALLVHGMFDAEIYIGNLATLAFLPAIALMSVAVSLRNQLNSSDEVKPSNLPSVAGLLVGLLLPAVLVLLLPGAPARWEANLGAVLQGRAELRLYHWPEWVLQDQVRRLKPEVLRPAVAHFQRAVALDPGQPTAQRRLGQIALAQGDVAAAKGHLLTAFAVDPGNRVARQLLGEVYAIEGDVGRATLLWKTVDNGQQQLQTRQGWYSFLGADVVASRIEEILRTGLPIDSSDR